MNSDIYLSVVIPVYNEEGNIDELLARTADMIKKTGRGCEIICVDDCSSDSSLEKMLRLKGSCPLRVIRLSEHRGQSGALASGFTAARGEYIAMIDADLQCLPEEIPLLLEAFDGPEAAVCGVRVKRNDSITKKISSFVGNGFRNLVLGENIADTNCPLKVFRASAIKNVVFFNGFHRFIPTLLGLRGCGVKYIPVTHLHRKSGRTKYSVINRLFKGLFDVIWIFWLKKNSFRPEEYKEL